MSNAHRQIEWQCLNCFAFLFESVAKDRILDRNGDAEEVRADVGPRVGHVRMRGIRGEDHTREEDIGLDAAIGEIEIEVIDAAQRNHWELKAGVVMNATEHEEPRRVESFLHYALARASLLEVAKTASRGPFAHRMRPLAANACRNRLARYGNR